MDIQGTEAIGKLSKDLRQSAALLSRDEVRYLVDLYYQIQDFRKASSNQIFSMAKEGEPTALLGWSKDQMEAIEKQIKKCMEVYTDEEETGMGKWAKSITGIGPVLAAGLLAHIDISRVRSSGQVWRFAGLDPSCKWSKGQKQPWNAALKVLCWKIGESFVKVSGNENDFYGKIRAKRKLQEEERNELLMFKDQAEAILASRKIGKDTEAYKAYVIGKLPKAQIHARAKRYAVKLFLAHWFDESYRRHYKMEPPLPYPVAFLNHAHVIEAKQ